MSVTLSVFTIGGGDLLQEVFNAVASVFNDKQGITTITSLAIALGGIFSVFQFIKSHDINVLVKWMGMYVLITSLMLYPKATVVIEDRTGIDLKPRIIDNVPLSLALVASVTSSIGIGFTEMLEAVFHLPDDLAYNKTGLLMGAKLVAKSQAFEITDPEFSQTLNEFMQQCVFYDLFLDKYTLRELLQTSNPWEFIKSNTSVARAFPFNGEVVICQEGAAKLDVLWKQEINNAATLYGGQILGNDRRAGQVLLSRLSDGYSFLTHASVQGKDILQTNLLSNAISQSVSYQGAHVNAPAALQAYQDTKAALQSRETMMQVGRQSAMWLPYIKNILEAVLYSAFIVIYFLSYFPFGGMIVRNYLFGLFYLQTLAPMYAMINFAATFLAQNRSMAFISNQHGDVLSLSNAIGISQANGDVMAVAGYLIWPVTIGGGIMLYKGLPHAMQHMGQLVGGVVQNSSSHVAAEAVGGNISAGNTSFDNHSMGNVSANHWDTTMRYSGGGVAVQTATGALLSITPGGGEILDERGAISNLGVTVNGAESLRAVASNNAQTSFAAGLTQTQSAGESYGAALRQMMDFSHQQGANQSSGESSTHSQTSGLSQSAQDVSQLVKSFAQDHHVNHERAAQVLGQVYADAKIGSNAFIKTGVGVSGSLSGSARSSFGGLFAEAERFAQDHHFSDTVDKAQREAQEVHYRQGADEGSRLANSISSSFDKANHYRDEATSQFSKSQSYSSLASTSTEQSASINANYTQEFYEWMRTQSSPLGNEKMSPSAIDNMGAHDLALLQGYATDFVNEKTAREIVKFEASHGITQGDAAIKAVHQHNSHFVNNAVSSGFARNNQSVNEAIEHASQLGQGIGHVNDNVNNQVNQSIESNQQRLDSQKAGTHDRGAHVTDKVNKTVEGQVIGSLDIPDKAKAMVSSAMNKFTKETVDE